jgi:hypothetical protein
MYMNRVILDFLIFLGKINRQSSQILRKTFLKLPYLDNRFQPKHNRILNFETFLSDLWLLQPNLVNSLFWRMITSVTTSQNWGKENPKKKKPYHADTIPTTQAQHFFCQILIYFRKQGLAFSNLILQNFNSWGLSMQNTPCPVHFVIVTAQVFNFQQFGKRTIKFYSLQLEGLLRIIYSVRKHRW